MKKIIAFLLVLAMVFSFVGCAKSEKKDDDKLKDAVSDFADDVEDALDNLDVKVDNKKEDNKSDSKNDVDDKKTDISDDKKDDDSSVSNNDATISGSLVITDATGDLIATQDNLKSVTKSNGGKVINLTFDSDGTAAYAKATKNEGDVLYIFYGSMLISMPQVTEQITDGKLSIDVENFTNADEIYESLVAACK